MKKLLAIIAGEFLPGLNFLLVGKPLYALALWAFIYASVIVLWLTLAILDGSRIACWTYVISLFAVNTLCNLYHPGEAPATQPRRRRAHTVSAALIIAASILIFPRLARMQYRVTSASMEPTLVVGTTIVADPFSYGLFGRAIDRGDLVAHRNPNDSVTLFIHRIIAIPGDSVEIRNGLIYVNGGVLERSRNKTGEAQNRARIGQLDFQLPACDQGHLPESFCSGLRMEYRWRTGSVGWRVPDGGFFLVGDDVYNSFDSKYYGILERKHIQSKVICFGINAEMDSGTLARMGRKID
jgi:signal peptidase I